MTEATNTTAAEDQLRGWARNNAERDQLVKAARAAGVSKNRIHTLTGISRSTIDRILVDVESAARDLVEAVGPLPPVDLDATLSGMGVSAHEPAQDLTNLIRNLPTAN